MTKRQKRMAAVAALVLGLAVAAGLGFTAFRKNMMYFYTPSDLVAAEAPSGAKLRLGGLVERGSVQRAAQGLEVSFTLADCINKLKVRYNGILPDLFREGQGIVATGRMVSGVFVADEVLAKHDENYMPPELAASLKTENGHSCMPFKSVTRVSEAPRPAAAAGVPRHAQRGEGGTNGGAVGGVRVEAPGLDHQSDSS